MPDPELEQLIKGMTPAALDIFKKQLPLRLKDLSAADRNIALDRLSGIQELGVPSAPSPQITPQPLPQGTPLWQKGLQIFGAPFQWLQEKAIEPFASVVTSPFSPSTPETQNLPFFERELGEYKKWEAPWGVKGAVETLPWFALPGIGTVAGKGGMIAGRGIAGALGKMGTAGKVAGTALEYSPWGLAEKAAGKVLTTAGKAIKKATTPVIEELMEKAGITGLPSEELLNSAYKENNFRQFARWSEKKQPVIAKAIKIIWGEDPFIKADSDLPIDIVRRTVLNSVRIKVRGGNLQGAEMPRLAKFGDPIKVLGITEDGIVNTARPKSGQSRYLNDILENPDVYNFSTPQAEQYIREFSRIRKDLRGLLEADGLKQSPKVHRIVKGIRTEDGKLVESKFGSDPSLSRIYETQEEAAIAHKLKGQELVYGVNPNEIMQYEFDRTINKIARKRFTDAIKPLGKTAIQKFAEIYPEKATQLVSLSGRQAAAKSALDVVQRVLSYKATTIPGATMAKINRELPDMAGKISVLFELAPPSVDKVISRMGRDLRSVLKTDPAELKKAVKIISDINTTWRGTPKITMMDIEDAINSLNLSADAKAKMITSGYQETYKANRQFFKDFMTTNRDYLVKVIDETKTIAAPLKKDRYKFLQGYAGRERLPHRAGEVTERPFNMIPEFRNKFFPDEIVTYLEKNYADEGMKWVRTMGNVGAMSRNLTAVLDDSAPFIQGLFTFGRNPIIWAKATARQFEYLANPEKLTLRMASPQKVALHAEMASKGSTIAYFEPMEAMPQLLALAGRVPKVGGALQTGIKQTYGRAEAAFIGFGQEARDLMWESFRKVRPNATESELQELARSLDLMTGNLSTKALGIGATQRDIESAFVFYSPRFTRASLAFIGDMLKGGISGAEARKSIGYLMASGAAMYMGVSKALGQEPNFDPSSGRFMTIKVGDDHIGIGGMLYSLARLGGNLATVDNPTDLLKLDRFDNPFVKFMYGKSAPLTGMIVGAFEQKDYMGQPFESLTDWAKFLAEKVTPFSVQPLFEETKPSSASFAAQFMGGRTFPKSPSELRTEERESQALKTYGTEFTSLTKLDQNKIDKLPEVSKLSDRIRAEGRETPESLAWGNFNQEGDTIETTYRKAVTLASKEFEATGDGTTFRTKFDEANSNRRALYAQRAINPQYTTIQQYFNTPKSPDALAKMNPLDIAREEYYRVMYSPDMYDQYGNYNFDEADRRETLFVQRYGQKAVGYVKEYTGSRWDEPAAVKTLRASRDILQPYWDIENQIWSNYPPQLKQLSDQIINVERTDPRGAKQMLFQYPQIVMARRIIALYRRQLKLRNPDIAQALNMFYQY